MLTFILLLKGSILCFCKNVLGYKQILTPRGMIPQGVSFFATKIRILSENLTKIENILTCWSVAQIDSNKEKNERPKISFYCPFNFNVPLGSEYNLYATESKKTKAANKMLSLSYTCGTFFIYSISCFSLKTL